MRSLREPGCNARGRCGMLRAMHIRHLLASVLAIAALLAPPRAAAQGVTVPDEVDEAIERGLEYLASVQKPDGSFPDNHGTTGSISALAGMAFLAKGYTPDSDKYGENIDRCIDYILSIVDPTNGYFGVTKPGSGMYVHAICTLFLTEVSGMVSPERQARMDPVIEKAVKLIIDAQNIRKSEWNQGGWRYTPKSSDSDMSCSGWVIMALRSARLNGARIPNDTMSRALDYVKRMCYSADGSFTYQGGNSGSGDTLTGAGILYLELCGRHNDPMALRAARFLTDRRRYTELRPNNNNNRAYGLYYASQGLFQIGGTGWDDFQRWMYSTWIPAQSGNGSWSAEENSRPYATAMVVLAFTPPYRQLPIYQRDEQVDED